MRIAIYGYGNIGRGVELAVQRNADMQLTGVFTRRDPSTVQTQTGAPVYSAASLETHASEIDVLVICAGSATDLPEMTPQLAARFNVVDSFDTHARIPEHFANVDAAARQAGNVALVCCGWDPGMFSLARVYAAALLPKGETYTFWGRGVSQGHSDAIRRIPGVLDARQYTVPREEVLAAVRAGERPELATRDKHTRECYVVADEGADLAWIETQIKTMPNYFSEYDTTVTFITSEEMARNHAEMPHGGTVIRSGETGLAGEHAHTVEYSLQLDSNPEFTGNALVAFARAIGRMSERGDCGCKTVFDIAPADLSPLSASELRAQLL